MRRFFGNNKIRANRPNINSKSGILFPERSIALPKILIVINVKKKTNIRFSLNKVFEPHQNTY